MPLLRPVSRPRRGVAAALAAAGAVALLLSGCTGGAPAASPAPSADAAEPIFATDEEALAAAESAYEAYIATVDQLTQEGGSNPERIRAVVDETYVEELIASLQRLSEAGNHTSGETTFDNLKLVERNEDAGVATVTAYICIDVSDVRVLNAAGEEVTPPDRIPRRPLQTTFISSNSEASKLLPSGSEQWAGDDFC